VAIIGMVMLIAGATFRAPPAGATITSDRAQIVQIEQQLADGGTRLQALVRRENAARATLESLHHQIARDQARLAADARAEAAARLVLQQMAVNAYVTGPSVDLSLIDVFSNSASITTELAHRTYLGAASSNIADAIATMTNAQRATEADALNLKAAQTAATRTLTDLRRQHHTINVAITTEKNTLAQVKSDLQAQLLAAVERQAASERTLAAYPWPTNDLTPVPIPPPTPGVYANPLRDVQGLASGRIDMGVDYSGFGPIYAIGDGVVLTTAIPGWPGGTMIAYQLTDGPANGLIVYAAEDIAPAVQIGDTVNSHTVLGLMYPGPDGIETGWGDPAIIGNTLAGDHHQFNGTNTTAYGANFAQLLLSLGAPPGIPQNAPPTGSLPKNWPQWAIAPKP
jgi:murein DD-endopeptidase MepM/ murein hydrolase activator NlpD